MDILNASTVYTSFGFEPFTPNNELRYKTFQIQDNFTWSRGNHSFTFGGTVEKYHSDNVFYPGAQSVYVYNSLADFYTDANDYLANPNRTVSPVTLSTFQVRWNNIPGQDKPLQPLDVWYGGLYAQDEWQAAANLKVTYGLRMDVSAFGDTGYQNADADALTFRNADGSPVQYQTAKLPDTKILWSPAGRLQLGRERQPLDPAARRHGRLHRPPDLRVDLQPGRQHGRSHRLRAAQQHEGAAVEPEPRRLQASHRDRCAGRDLRAGPDRPGLQVPPGVAKQPRGRPAPALGPDRHGASSSTAGT